MRADHAAVGVEIDLHFGHRELERAALEAAGAEDHCQLMHPGEQRIHFWCQVTEYTCRVTFFSLAEGGGLLSGRELFRSQVFVDLFIREPAPALDSRLEDIGCDPNAF